MLRARGLDRHFRFIVAAGETPASKPAPDPYRKRRGAARPDPAGSASRSKTRAGASSRPRRPGLWCVGITHTYPVAELLDADAIITSLDELTPELIGR